MALGIAPKTSSWHFTFFFLPRNVSSINTCTPCQFGRVIRTRSSLFTAGMYRVYWSTATDALEYPLSAVLSLRFPHPVVRHLVVHDQQMALVVEDAEKKKHTTMTLCVQKVWTDELPEDATKVSVLALCVPACPRASI